MKLIRPTCYITVSPLADPIDSSVQQELAGQMLAQSIISTDTYMKLR
jgi:hypothetical protein